MTPTPIPADKIADLIKVLQSGIRFYRVGINAARCESSKDMFSRMLAEKEQACAELRAYCDDVKDSESVLAVDARNLYTRLISRISANRDQMFIEQLAVMERRILQTFDEVLGNPLPQHCAQLLRKIRTRLLQCYDELLALKINRKKLARDRI